MNKYEMVGAILVIGVPLVVAFVNIINPILKLNASIVALTEKIEAIINADNRRDERISTHGREIDNLSMRATENTTKLINHERRIEKLEERGCMQAHDVINKIGSHNMGNDNR